ncbi:MAG: BlaI/MecI/CopY family transcriptional regulator [Thermoanaerobaculia bacterium]
MRRRVSDLLRTLAGGRLDPIFGALERRVLDAVWRRDAAASVRSLSKDFPGTAYTTLMTTLDRLHRKGFLDREKAGRAYLYRPRYTREELPARMAADALRALFAREPGALRPALSFLVDEAGGEDERLLDELEALVRERRRLEREEES